MKSVYVRICTTCNASCAMCEFWQRPALEMRTDTAIHILSRVAELGFDEVILTGGEPLLAAGLPEVLRVCGNLGLKVSVITNGSMLSTSLITNGDGFRVQRFFLSVDSPCPRTHDSIRGVPCINAIEGWLAARPDDVDVVVNTVVSRLNREDVLDVPDWMSSHRISTINVIAMKSPDQALGPELDGLLIAFLQKCYGYGIRHFVPGYPLGAPCSEAIRAIGRSLPSECHIYDVCMFVELDGSVYPCNCSSYSGEQAKMGMLTEPCESSARVATHHVALADGRRPPLSFCAQRCDLSNRLFNGRELWHAEGLT